MDASTPDLGAGDALRANTRYTAAAAHRYGGPLPRATASDTDTNTATIPPESTGSGGTRTDTTAPDTKGDCTSLQRNRIASPAFRVQSFELSEPPGRSLRVAINPALARHTPSPSRQNHPSRPHALPASAACSSSPRGQHRSLPEETLGVAPPSPASATPKTADGTALSVFTLLRQLHEAGKGLPAKGKRPEGRHACVLPPTAARASGTQGLGYTGKQPTIKRPRNQRRHRHSGTGLPQAGIGGSLTPIAFVTPAAARPLAHAAERIRDAIAFATAAAADTQANDEQTRAQRASFLLLAGSTPITEDAAGPCLQAAKLLLRSTTGHIRVPLRKAVDLLLKAVVASPALLKEAMLICVAAAPSGGFAKPVARRLRHAIRTMFDTHGPAAYAAFAMARKVHSSSTHPVFDEWDVVAAKKISSMPLSAEQWLDASIDKGRPDYSVLRSGEGCVEWTGAFDAPTNPTHLVSWNANSLFKRVRTGELAALLRRMEPDVLHVSEIKGSPESRPEVHALRTALWALGYRHVAWNWCATTPGNHGSAVFSKCRMSVHFGTGTAGTTDEDGRTITTVFPAFAVVWTYTPCSTMGSAEPEERRSGYDTRLTDHVLRVQASEGTDQVFVAGDFNTAPSVADCSLPLRCQQTTPSCKTYEREGHARLRARAGLTDAAVHFGAQHHTWRHKGNTRFSMRLDHVLAPAEWLPRVSLLGSSEFYGSDHRPIGFYIKTLANGEHAESAPAAAASPNRSATTVSSVATETASSAARTGSPPGHLDQALVRPQAYEGILRKAKPSDKRVRGYRLPFAAPEPTRPPHSKPPDHAPRAGAVHDALYVRATIKRLSKESQQEYLLSRRVLQDWVPLPTDILSKKGWHTLAACVRAIMQNGPRVTAAAMTRGTMPTYRCDDYAMHHSTSNVMPDTFLPMGDDATLVRTLWDSGAFFNIMTNHMASELGLTVKDRDHLPSLQLADGSITSPIGTVEVPVSFGGHKMCTEFYIMPRSPYPAMLGSHFFKSTATQFLYGPNDECVTLSVGDVRARIPFERLKVDSPFKAVAALHPSTEVTIPSRTEMNVAVRFQGDTRDLQGAWGLVKDAGKYALRVATGFSRVETGDGYYRCRVLNASDKPVKVSPTSPLALLQPLTGHLADDFHVFDGDGFFGGPTEGATQCAATPATITLKELETEWATRPHLKDLDLSESKATLSPKLYARLMRLVLDHHELWDTRPKEPPPDAHTCDFAVAEGAEWNAKTRPMAPPMRAQLRTITREQLERNIIEPSISKFSSAVVLVPKKGGGMRFAIDYRRLNAAIDADSYTLPKIDEALTSLHGNTFFSSLDMKEAFWSVPLAEHCKQYTAFQTPDGLMQYRRMPMGLKTASAVFSRYVDHMLGDIKFINVLAYIDDLLIFARTAEEHLDVLGRVFAKLRQFNMTLGAKKCSLFAPSVGFLGHVVSKEGVRTDPKKIKAVEALQLPDSKQSLSSALGLMAYYRKFIDGYSKVEKPLRDKLNLPPPAWRKVDGKVPYSDKEKEAFFKIRGALSREPILGHPDWSQPFELHTDACKEGLGAVLCQRIDGKERVISYASRCITSAEANYSVWELECLAIVWATRLFRMYLTGAKFTIVTDSKAAKNIVGEPTADMSGRLMRWSLALQEFNPFSVTQRRGKRHGNADGLSRHPIQDTEPYGEGPTDVEPMALLHAGFFCDMDEAAANTTDFTKLQDVDEWCQAFFRSKKAATGSPRAGEVYRHGNGLLMRASSSGHGVTGQVLVPLCLRAFILRRYHGLPVSGHLGVRRTLKALAREYYWPGMHRDVKRWIRACLACRRRKTPRNLHAGHPGSVSTATHPWEIVAVDVVSANVESRDKYVKILTMVDLFSRYVIAVPLRSTKAREIGGALFSNLFCKFGKPKRIHSDEGKEFCNEALKGLYDKWDIRHSSTGGYQPQANPVERFHRFLNSSMTMLASAFGQEWPDYLPAATFAYNASVNDATGFAPHEIVLGTTPRLLHGLPLNDWTTDPTGTPDIAKYCEEMGSRLQAAYKHVREQQERIASTNRRLIEQRRGKQQRKLPTYEVGDQVLFWEPRQSKKLAPKGLDLITVSAPQKWTEKWSGPHTISKRKKDQTGHRYTFFHKERGRDIETHSNKLCLFQPWSQGLASTSGDIDAKRLYRCGEWAEVDALVVVPLHRPYPFGIAKVLTCDESGNLNLQWLGNSKDNVLGRYEPGWRNPRSETTYYAPTPRDKSDVPYTADMDKSEVVMSQRDVLIHGFELTAARKLPATLLEAIGRHPHVWWTPPRKK